jgi:hypothetical protein
MSASKMGTSPPVRDEVQLFWHMVAEVLQRIQNRPMIISEYDAILPALSFNTFLSVLKVLAPVIARPGSSLPTIEG